MKKIVILGNGPSIKFLKLKNEMNTNFIGTNNIYLKKYFSNLNNQYYTAYDPRILAKKDWLKFIKNYNGNIFFPNIWRLNKELKNINKKINYSLPFSNLNTNHIIKKYKKNYCDSKDLEGTVLIEMAIPLAIALGAKDISLYGCELNYKLSSNNLTTNSYFYSNINNKNHFSHDKKSSNKWSEIQTRKMKKINLFLKSHKIYINDFSLNGKLSFLKNNKDKNLYF